MDGCARDAVIVDMPSPKVRERGSARERWRGVRGVILAVAEDAARGYGRDEHGQANMFNTAGVQQVLRDLAGTMPDSARAVEMLESHPSIVRLSGGCHWLILPDGLERYEAQAEPPAC